MDLYAFASTIVTLAILIAYVNHRYIKMQTTIAITCASVILSLIILLLTGFGFQTYTAAITTSFTQINFNALLINGMLSFLLFAGSLSLDLSSLKANRWEVVALASFSTILSTFLVGIGTFYLFRALAIPIDFIYCLLFGALISPTDPIAVLATFKQLNAPRDLEVIVAGESLFNDGVGIVMFITIYQIAFAHQQATPASVILLFLQQALGGIIFGCILGFVTSRLIYYAKDHKIEILLTIAVASGGYSLGQYLGISGPLAMVVAGFIIGNYARHHCMSKHTPAVLDEFWELIDELLNAVLFFLIGFELLTLTFSLTAIMAALLTIPLVLLVRFITVALPINLFKFRKNYRKYTVSILVWGGLRGGLAIALALALPREGQMRDVVLLSTYLIVAFAVIIQGLTIAPLVRLAKRSDIEDTSRNSRF